jgi:hypothetical protein
MDSESSSQAYREITDERIGCSTSFHIFLKYFPHLILVHRAKHTFFPPNFLTEDVTSFYSRFHSQNACKSDDILAVVALEILTGDVHREFYGR